ncbi:MAG TPA: signal peptidase I [Usitatibacteraceae bacterium]|nr:signal peptidase I [Usitatibacteraceae bacterium]
MTGWIALAISGSIIVAGLFAGKRRPAAAGTAMAAADGEQHPMAAMLEIAWPVFFIACMGMLTLKEVMSFAAVLLLATAITGVVWACDHFFLRHKRAVAAEPVVVEMSRSFFPVIAIVFLLRSFLYEPFKIPSESMLPTLQVGDFILVNKFTYGIRIPVINQKVTDGDAPKRGDVMVFRYPVDPHKDFIKRVVGLPGDKVAYRDKRLSINGRAVDTVSTGTQTRVDENLGMRRFDSYREVLGDRAHHVYMDTDIPGVRLSGVRRFPYIENCEYNNDGFSCTVPPGHFFMMGDNRDNSDDSRYWGFVPERNIVGKAVRIWMNFSAPKRIGDAIE